MAAFRRPHISIVVPLVVDKVSWKRIGSLTIMTEFWRVYLEAHWRLESLPGEFGWPVQL
jgi:hypothetical protein